VKNKWRDEVINYLKKLKLRNRRKIFKDGKAWNNLFQKTQIHVGVVVSKEEKDVEINVNRIQDF
jgi:hypothetical protein